MTRYILLALLIVLCDHAADFLVGRQFAATESTAYTPAQVKAMDDLVMRSTGTRRPGRMSSADQAAAIVYLYGDVK